MSNIWIAGDLHLGHGNIHKYRPRFETAEEHDQYVIEEVLSKGGARNQLLLLGDCFFTEESLDALREFRKAYGKIILILGNHDTDTSIRKANIRTMIKEDLVDELHGTLKKWGFWWSHVPFHPDELRGRINIHAHSHGKVIEDPRYIGLSLEQTDYKMVDLNYVKQLDKGRESDVSFETQE